MLDTLPFLHKKPTSLAILYLSEEDAYHILIWRSCQRYRGMTPALFQGLVLDLAAMSFK